MEIIFQSQSMQQVMERARCYAKTSATVLVTGESGTGKELVARYIHDQSSRRTQRYCAVNCAAFSTTLAESELFAHEQGSFTSADRRRLGHLEATADGTLFLDEIGELPLSIQAKLLRVLEQNEFYRVGGNDACVFKARVIAATNRDLDAEVNAGRFRDDLFHRLDVLPLRIPPLRERPNDIPALVNHFLRVLSREVSSPALTVSKQVMEKLRTFHWPGNVRQLRNVLHRACVLTPTAMVTECELPAEKPKLLQMPQQFYSMPLEEIERQIIMARIQHCQGNKTAAANALGVTARTLRNKVAKYREDTKAA